MHLCLHRAFGLIDLKNGDAASRDLQFSRARGDMIYTIGLITVKDSRGDFGGFGTGWSGVPGNLITITTGFVPFSLFSKLMEEK